MSNIEVRRINKESIVELLLREESLTKAEITNYLGMSLATVNILIKELLNEGIVEQGEVLKSTGGRRPTLYQAVSDYKIAVGVAISDHHIRISFVNWKLHVKKCEKHKIIFQNTDEYWAFMKEAVFNFLEENSISEDRLRGIGISIPSHIVSENNLEGIVPIGVFEGVDIQKLKNMFNCKVMISDAIKAAAFSHIGTKKDKRRCVYMHLGSIVGGGLINNGDFFGMSNRTADFGNMAFDTESLFEENTDPEVKKGSFEYYFRKKALLKNENITLEEFFRELDNGSNSEYTNRWKNYLKRLILVLYNFKAIFDVDICLGGEISPYVQKRDKEIREVLSKNDIYNEEADYIHYSKGEEYDCCIGSGFLVLEKEAEYF